jgi:hypothetical protein
MPLAAPRAPEPATPVVQESDRAIDTAFLERAEQLKKVANNFYASEDYKVFWE